MIGKAVSKASLVKGELGMRSAGSRYLVGHVMKRKSPVQEHAMLSVLREHMVLW